MSVPFREIKNSSCNSNSSYETASNISFEKRSQVDKKDDSILKNLKEEINSDSDYEKKQNDMSILENDISMMSVSSPKTSLNNQTPIKKLKNKNSKCNTPGEDLLQKLKDEKSKIILQELYPELFTKPEIIKEENEKKKQENDSDQIKCSFQVNFDENDDKENIPPWKIENKFESEKFEKSKFQETSSAFNENKTVFKQESIQITKTNNDKKYRKINNFRKSPTPESENDLDNYLLKLRENLKTKSNQRTSNKLKKEFLVSDSDISEKSEESEESENYENEYSDKSEQESSFEEERRKKSSKCSETKNVDDDSFFLKSLSENYKGKRHDSVENFMKKGAMRLTKNREILTLKLVEILKRRCFPEIPNDSLQIIWNSRLRKSAGQCRNHSNGNSTIEMSPTVCTTPERIRDTLIHEICHASVWIVDKLYKEGHGPGWKKWAHRCMKTFQFLPVVERCHNYEIEAKFIYVCENEICQQTIKRQSKSLDINRKVCGKCKSRFILYRNDRRTNQRILIKSENKETDLMQSENLNQFALFVKKNYNQYKAEGVKHVQIMEKLSQSYKKEKMARKDEEK